MRDISQQVLIEKFIMYLESRGKSLTDSKKQKMRNGLCFGLSAVFSYMAAHSKEKWWTDVLKKISEWDGDIAKLEEPTLIQDAINPQETLKSLFERAIHYATYHHGTSEALSGFGYRQGDTLKQMGLFFSESGEIKTSAVASGNFSRKNLHALLDKQLFEEKQCVFVITSMTHACTIRCAEGKWRLYNPAYSFGEQTVSDEEFLDTLNRALVQEHDLSFDGSISCSLFVSSWREDAEIKNKVAVFSETYQRIVDEGSQSPGLISDNGLTMMILQGSPEHARHIISSANISLPVQRQLLMLLPIQGKSLGNTTLLHLIAQYLPEVLLDLVALAKKDLKFKSLGKEKSSRIQFETALVTRKSNGRNALMDIVFFAPNHFSEIIEFAKEDKSFRKVFITALNNADNNGWGTWQMIIQCAPAQLTELILLAKEDDTLRKSLIASLSHTNSQNTTTAQQIGIYSPEHLSAIINLALQDQEGTTALITSLKNLSPPALLTLIATHASNELHKIIPFVNSYSQLNTIRHLIKSKDAVPVFNIHQNLLYRKECLHNIIANFIDSNQANKDERIVMQVLTAKKLLDDIISADSSADIDKILSNPKLNKKNDFFDFFKKEEAYDTCIFHCRILQAHVTDLVLPNTPKM